MRSLAAGARLLPPTTVAETENVVITDPGRQKAAKAIISGSGGCATVPRVPDTALLFVGAEKSSALQPIAALAKRRHHAGAV